MQRHLNAYEVNFDGIVGPTHNYSGLSYGNIASMKHRKATSNPKAAALQGLEKMARLMRLGLKQAVLPPHERPYLPILRLLGFEGSDVDVLAKTGREAPQLLAACSSAAPMWVANAATISPSVDSLNSLLHITPANLSTKPHRTIEQEITTKVLKAIFPDAKHFHHHRPLPCVEAFSDEGAANHIRLCDDYAAPGLQIFVFGRYAFKGNTQATKRFPARQSCEASQAIARKHQLNPDQVLFVQQNPEAIDRGVFHNDVISVANQYVFFYHEKAFVNTPEVLEKIQKQAKSLLKKELVFLEVKEKHLSVEEAVTSYLFNSQIVTLEDEAMALIAPEECLKVPSAKEILENILSSQANNPIKHLEFFNLKESMQNGGGPACLRLRIVLTEKEKSETNPHIFLDQKLYTTLCSWVRKHYRDRLDPKDLADPHLLEESRRALDELTQILNLGPIYDFQQG